MRDVEDASRIAMAASLLVATPDIVRGQFSESDGHVTLEALVLGDISKAPVPARATQPDLLPLLADGSLAGYDARLGTYAPYTRLFGLTFDQAHTFDLHARRPAEYVVLGNVLAGRADDQSGGTAPFVAALDSLIFKVPMTVLEAYRLKVVLMQAS